MNSRLRLVAATAAIVVGASLTAAESSFAAEGAPPPTPTDTPERITLITGDQVTVSGKAIAVDPGPGREKVQFTTRTEDNDHYVIPSDALPLIHEGVVDDDLFNVALPETRRRTAIKVLVEGRAEVPAARQARRIPKSDLTGMKVRRGEEATFWWSVAGGRTKSLGGGVQKLLLDRNLKLSLDESVPLIGAPKAWEAGVDGKDVTVGVLDTGIDANHPDLDGQVTEAKSFIDGEDAKDGHGHGTHVATTIAGRGDQYKGVAPGAKLLVGKVCGADGTCPTSAIMAAMSWIAGKAPVVNMSLGGGPTDGTDELSTHLNKLTGESGTLFVTAAGNYGCEQCVGTPATADAALAVAATDKSDKLADFSSRGPRVGDFAVKPEIAAPGVDITAGRAEGTEMGTPVDERYTTASGTSMATPHVAGAAAILAQKHKDLKGAGLKDALVSTAKDAGHGLFEQGAGRVEIPSALDSVVYGSASVSFGTVEKPSTKKVTYTNTGDQDVTLNLGLDLRTSEGEPAPDGLGKLGATKVAVPAGGRASADLTIDPGAADPGTYSGLVIATAGDTTLRTSISTHEEAPKAKLTVKMLNAEGDPVPQELAFVAGGGDLHMVPVKDGVGSVEVPAGTWTAAGWVYERDRKRTAWTAVTNHKTDGSKPAEVVLDARKAVPASAKVPEATKELDHQISLGINQGETGNFGSAIIGVDSDWKLSATPAAPMEGDATLVVQDNYTLAGEATADGNPESIYNLNFSRDDGIPSSLEHAVSPEDLHTIDTRYHADVPKLDLAHWWYGYRKGSAGAMVNPKIKLTAPATITQHVNRDDQVDWHRIAELSDDKNNHYYMHNMGPFQETERWFEGPVAPAAAPPYLADLGDTAFSRLPYQGRELFIPTPYINDSVEHHVANVCYGGDYPITWKLFQGDKEIPGEGLDCIPFFPMPPEEGTFTLKGSLKLAPTAFYGPSQAIRAHTPQVDGEWTFTSSPAGKTAFQPILQLSYDLGLDLTNRAPKSKQHKFIVGAYHQKDAVGAAPIKALKLAYSVDEGKTWKEAKVRSVGNGRYEVKVKNPASGSVWLRTEAADEAGNSIKQTVHKAYSVTG